VRNVYFKLKYNNEAFCLNDNTVVWVTLGPVRTSIISVRTWIQF